MVELTIGILHPGVNGLDGLVKVVQGSAEIFDLLDLLLKPGNNLELLLDSLDLLLDEVLLVFRESHGHDIVVVLDGSEHALNGVFAVVEDLLPLLQVLKGGLQVEAFLDLLDLLLGALEVGGNGLKTLGITLPGSLGVLQKLETGLSLVLGLIPTLLNTLDMAVQELGFAVEEGKILVIIK